MKRLFSFMVLILFGGIAFGTSLIENAQKELDSAKEHFTKTLRNSEIALSKKQAEYTQIYAQIEKAKNELNLLESQAVAVKSLKQKRDFYKDVCSEISDEIARTMPKQTTRAVSAEELYDVTKIRLQDMFNAVKKSLQRNQIVVSDIKTKQKYTGKTFRIGGVNYFLDGKNSGFLNSQLEVYGKDFADEIVAFADGKSDVIPVDTSFGQLEKNERNKISIYEEIEKGGVWIFPILLLGMLSCLVVVGKIIQLLFMPNPISVMDNIALKAQSQKDRENVLLAFIVKTNLKLKSFTSVLSISAGVSPLFGLLGTVSGIIKTFADLSVKSSAQANQISDGIAEALITTEYGLIVAIPALIANALILRKIKKITDSMNIHASKLTL